MGTDLLCWLALLLLWIALLPYLIRRLG